MFTGQKPQGYESKTACLRVKNRIVMSQKPQGYGRNIMDKRKASRCCMTTKGRSLTLTFNYIEKMKLQTDDGFLNPVYANSGKIAHEGYPRYALHIPAKCYLFKTHDNDTCRRTDDEH